MTKEWEVELAAIEVVKEAKDFLKLSKVKQVVAGRGLSWQANWIGPKSSSLHAEAIRLQPLLSMLVRPMGILVFLTSDS
jgi:hypothetical protein